MIHRLGFHLTTSGFAAVVLAGTLSTPLAAQTTSDTEKKAATVADKPQSEARNDNLLAGPKVKDTESARDRRGMMTDRPQSDRGRERPVMHWVAALREIDLTEEQRQEVQKIIEELKAAHQKFEAEHAERRQELMSKLRQARQDGTQPGPELRQQMQRLQEAAPKAEVYQQRVWKILSSEQQSSLRSKLAEVEKREAEERAKREANSADRMKRERQKLRGTMDEMDQPRKRPLNRRPMPTKPTTDQPGSSESADAPAKPR